MGTENEIEFNQLPEPVRAAAEKYFGTSAGLKAMKGAEYGQTHYEIEGPQGGKTVEVTFDRRASVAGSTVAAGVLACRRGRASRGPDCAHELSERGLRLRAGSAGRDATALRQARTPAATAAICASSNTVLRRNNPLMRSMAQLPEMLPRVFDRFFRGDPAHGNGVDGCGLGLSIAQWIVSAHRGSMQIASEPAKSTLVTVRLPLEAEAVQSA